MLCRFSNVNAKYRFMFNFNSACEQTRHPVVGAGIAGGGSIANGIAGGGGIAVIGETGSGIWFYIFQKCCLVH